MESYEPFKPSKQLICIFVVVGLLNLTAAIDATSITTTLPTITADLNGTAIEAFWSGTSFLVTSAVFQPIFSLASDLFGRKAVLLTAVLFFTVGAILAAVAQGFPLLLAGRAVQGTGGGGIMALTEILIADLIPLRDRGKWFVARSGTWALGSVVGPIIGGAFATASAWRWIFWINLPFCGIGLALIPIFLRLEKGPQRVQLATVDYIGIVLFTTSLSSFLIPLSWGGIMYAWDSWHTLVPLLLGVAGFFTFAIYERLIPSQPLITPGIFTNRTIIINYTACCLHGITLGAVVYYVPLYFQGALGYSPLISGVGSLPECLTVPPLSVITGFVIAKTGQYRWALWAGWAISVLGLGVMSLLENTSSIPKWVFINAVPGVGLGMLFAGPILAVQASANPEYISMSVTLTAFFRTVGQAVGVAGGGVVFQNRMRAEFEANPILRDTAEEFSREAAGLVQYINRLPEGEEKREMRAAYAEALKVVWLVMCGLAGVGLVLSLFSKAYSLHQVLSSKQGLKTASSVGVGEGSEQVAQQEESGDEKVQMQV